MLGNDVVDLRDADSRPESFHTRFEDRVFSAEERRAIGRDAHPLARRWVHWAAKEAAYKLVKQIDSRSVFSPIRFVADFEPLPSDVGRRIERRGIVRLSGGSDYAPSQVDVRSFETEERVHVIALGVGADWGAVDFAVERLEATSIDSSVSVRQLAIREISRSLGIEAHRLSIPHRNDPAAGWSTATQPIEVSAPSSSRIPIVELDGVPTSLALSLSHHGRFISFAMTPRLESANHANRRSEQHELHAAAGAMRP